MSACDNFLSLGFPSQKPDEDVDIQRIARELIDRYADDAELVAAGHADTLLDLGDIEAFEIWRDIAAAIHAIRGETPHSLEY